MKKNATLFVVGALVVMMVLMVETVLASDWPMFHHDLALSGYTSDPAPLTNDLLWTFQTGGACSSSPAVVGRSVYIGSTDSKLYSLDKYTGALNWQFNAGSPIYSSPAVSSGKVYFLAGNGVVYALDAMTGLMVWNTPLGAGPWDWSSPAIHAGHVLVASSNGTLYSLDMNTGGVAWSAFIGGTPDSPITVVNGLVYSGTHNFDNFSSTLVAVNEISGAVAWTYDYFLYHGGVVGMVNSNGAAVVDSNGDGVPEVHFGVHNWSGVSDQAVCLDEANGNEVWTQTLQGNSTSTPAVHGGRVFIGSDDHRVYALSGVDGSVLWSYLTGGAVWSSPAVSGNGQVCFGSKDHTVYCVDEVTGTLTWSYFTGASRIDSSPAISEGILYIGNENGKVYAFGKPCPEDPNPASQGYWHRQCLGVPSNPDNPAAGGLDPGRNGRGPQEPTEAEFTKDLMPAVTARLENLVFEMDGSCAGGMAADPPSDKCEKALKQYTALLFNIESGRIGEGCQVELSSEGCASTDIGSLVDELAALINSGDEGACTLAASCAGAVNEGTALTESLVVQSVEAEMPLNADLAGFDWKTSERSATSISSDRDAEGAPGEVTVPLTPAMPVSIVAGPMAVEAKEQRAALTVNGQEPLTLKRHLAILANPAAPEKVRFASRDALLTLLSGGYEVEVRLEVAEALVGQVEAAFHSLLVAHLEDIRREAVDFSLEALAKRAERLLERLGADREE